MEGYDAVRNVFTEVVKTLVVQGTLTDFLFQEKALNQDDIEIIQKETTQAQKARELLCILFKHPDTFPLFWKALEMSNQSHIRKIILEGVKRSQTQSKCNSGNIIHAPMECDEKNDQLEGDAKNENAVVDDNGEGQEINDLTGEDGNKEEDGEEKEGEEEGEEEEEEEEGEEEEEEDAQTSKLKAIIEFKNASKQKVTIHATVITRDHLQMKSGEYQFMAVLADETSSVDCCVRNEELFPLFRPKSGILLKNVKWSGKVLFVSKLSAVSSVTAKKIPQEVIEQAFGTGRAISIFETKKKQDNDWFALQGKVIKISDLTRKEMFSGKKILTHRQILLADDSGSVNIDVWDTHANNIQLGNVISLTSCKKRIREEGPPITTTRKTELKILDPKLFPGVHEQRLPKAGILQGIRIDTYQSCKIPTCYNFRLIDDQNAMLCNSCGNKYEKTEPTYGEAKIDVLSKTRHIYTLTVYWPQLEQLFQLYNKSISILCVPREIESIFHTIAAEERRVKYYECGNVQKFKKCR